jgi:hypothetical protein
MQSVALKAVVALCLIFALASAQDEKATRTAFTATNALITDSLYAGGPGRTYRADIQYWPNAGEEAIFFTIPYALGSSATGSFEVFEDFANNLRYVQCSESCRVEPLDRSLFDLANTASLTSATYPAYERVFNTASGSTFGSLAARPSLPSLCQAQSSASSAADSCMPYGLPCGTSCICLGCTDGDNCTGSFFPPMVNVFCGWRGCLFLSTS